MAPEFGTFISILLQVVALAVLPTVTVTIVLLARAKWKEIQSYMTAEQIMMFNEATKMVIQSAQASGAAGLIINTGEAKKQEAIDNLQAIVDANKWNIPVAQIAASIEAGIFKGWHIVEEADKAKTPDIVMNQPVLFDTKDG